ncbi:MAG: hypothetical protein HXK75_01695 [Granulicatella sp.]|nr:hypothetical protein [Granulicatella sp.]
MKETFVRTKEKLVQVKETFMSLSTPKKVGIITACAVVLLGGGYAVSALVGQTDSTQEITQVTKVATETINKTESKELKELQEKVTKGNSETMKKEDKETLEKSIKDSKLSDKDKAQLLKQLDTVVVAEQPNASETKKESTQQETKTEQKSSETTVVANHQQATASNSLTDSSGSSSSQENNQPQAEVRTQTVQETNSTPAPKAQEEAKTPNVQETKPTPEPPQTQAPKKAPVRLTALGNTGMEFATLKEAGAWLEAKMEESFKAVEEGKQNWAYTGNYFEIPWSDGHTTASVNLRKQ